VSEVTTQPCGAARRRMLAEYTRAPSIGQGEKSIAYRRTCNYLIHGDIAPAAARSLYEIGPSMVKGTRGQEGRRTSAEAHRPLAGPPRRLPLALTSAVQPKPSDRSARQPGGATQRCLSSRAQLLGDHCGQGSTADGGGKLREGWFSNRLTRNPARGRYRAGLMPAAGARICRDATQGYCREAAGSASSCRSSGGFRSRRRR
jgi:hypothetical protein